MTTTAYKTVQAADDPALTNRIVTKALAEPTPYVDDSTRKLRPLPVTIVRLPGGFRTERGYVYDVEVRELTGEDEEALAKATTVPRALMTILARATVAIGDVPVTPAALDDMLAGDREMVLLQIRKATYGVTEEYMLHCIACSTDQKATVNLDTDIKVRTLANPDDRDWEMTLRCGVVHLSLPDGAAQRKVASAGEKTIPELNTLLLSECIQQINDDPPLGMGTARSLGLADRTAIIEEIARRQPGPELGEVTKPCESCGADIKISLDLARLFRL